ncbi:MAG TPA: septation protein SepH [Acidothermaceae bacterium]
MAQLRLVGVSEDGERLVLAGDDGVQHEIVIDERLRAGVHGHLSRLGQLTMALESRISPREIQNRVRSGESAEHVAQTAGVPLERVLRFVGPVLREREHIADQARRARLAGSSGPASLLGDLVSRAASRRGVDADDVDWDSARREDHTWVVTTAWPDGTTAMWALDLLRHQATPLDTAARRISGSVDEATDESTAKSRGFPDIANSPDFARFDANQTDAVRLETGPDSDTGAKVHQFIPRSVPTAVEDLLPDDTAVEDVVEDIEADDEVLAEVDEPSAVDTSVDNDDAVASTEPTAEPAAGTPRRQGGRAVRRAAVPKWDDIMFGMKPKDGS